MRRRSAIAAVLVGLGALAAVLLVLVGGTGRTPRETVAALADRVVRGASAVLVPARTPAAGGGEGLHVTLPDAVIHPPAGSGPPQTDSTAAAVYAAAGWRSALITAAAASGIPALTGFVTTDRAGVQAPGSAFYLDGSVRMAPGENPAATMTRLDKVSPAAARGQLDDNLRVLVAGLPAGTVLGATISQLPVDHGNALALELRVADLRGLRRYFGDLFNGLATGLAPGPGSTVEGLAIHVVDARGRNAGSWMATRAQQGTMVIDPRIGAPAMMVPRMRFVNETGGPGAVPSAHAGLAAPAG